MATYTHCKTCNSPLRPKGTLAADHPGTKGHACHSLCHGCWDRQRRNSPPPAPDPDTVAGLNNFLAHRRQRLGQPA